MLQFPDIDPVIISYGELKVTWYALAYIFGTILGGYYARYISNIYKLNISAKNIEDYITFAIIGIIIGGRLGYVLFYDIEKYLQEPMEILKTYKGGMSFHGGFIGILLASCIFAKVYRKNLFLITDLLAMAAPIGIFLGRLANFINAELYGRVTEIPWGFIFPYSDGRVRHPSQLYEALLEGMLLFIILFLNQKKIRNNGYLSSLFLIFYAIFRIVAEFFREPDWHIGFIFGDLTMGQLLSLPLLILGLIILIKVKKDENSKI